MSKFIVEYNAVLEEPPWHEWRRSPHCPEEYQTRTLADYAAMMKAQVMIPFLHAIIMVPGSGIANYLKDRRMVNLCSTI
jgi:hypothetical protein